MKQSPAILKTLNPDETPKISISRCREILTKNGLAYTDEEVTQIRDFLYHLAEIGQRELETKQQQGKIISLTDNKINEYETSHYLRTG